jgi:uncharacterized protein
VLPRSPVLAVPSAVMAGAALPGCECARSRSPAAWGPGGAAGRGPGLHAGRPAVNPVVLVATAVAFPGRPEMVAARFCGSLLTSITARLVFWSWARPWT